MAGRVQIAALKYTVKIPNIAENVVRNWMKTDESNILISVVGPTAMGKTSLAIALAKHFNTEILSADSRQFYKEMTLGTAVPSKAELREVPHHFIQHISIYDPYTVGDFERDAMELLQRLFRKQQVVIMAGGSGLYLRAVTDGLDEFPAIPKKLRQELNRRLNEQGLEILQDELRVLDETYYANADIQNPQRLIRALEVSISTGKPYSSFLSGKKKERPFKTLTIGLKADRKTIYERINQRVDVMMASGLLEEAKTLYPNRHLNALQTVGYKELFEYLDNKLDLDEAIGEIKKNTRRFAKRQLTWFRKKSDIFWIDYLQPHPMTLQMIEAKIHGTG